MIQEKLRRNALFLILPLLAALLSFFVLAGVASSSEFHKHSIAALEEKQTTVLELSAASAAASAAITLIPGDAATPIAEQLADLSSHFLVVLCAIYLEKYLLTITGFLAFKILIPVACLAYILNVLFDWRGLRLLAGKLAAFGLLIVLVIPVSLQLSNMIEDTYQASIDATIQSAQDAAEEIEDSAAEGGDEKGFWAGLLDGITHAASGAADKVGRMANDFLEALAVMLVTSCIIPILVLLSFVWLAKTLLSIQIQIPLPGRATAAPRPASRTKSRSNVPPFHRCIQPKRPADTEKSVPAGLFSCSLMKRGSRPGPAPSPCCCRPPDSGRT